MSIKFINPALENLTGYTKEAVIGVKPPFPWWPKTQESSGDTQDKIPTSEGKEAEHCWISKNGDTHWLNATINLVKENGKLKYQIGTFVDITEQKSVEDALRESEEFSSSLRDNSPYPIMVLNPDTSIRYVNPALEKITGFTAAKLLGQKPPFSFWPEELKEQYLDKFMINLQTNFTLERLFLNKNGGAFWVNINSNPIMEGDSIKYILAIWADITAQKNASQN